MDLNGTNFSTSNTRGKFLVIKTWFIQCHACVEEMPRLNKMVDFFKARNDIEFISLALDDDKSLRYFLKKRKFSYTVVAEAGRFIDKLKLSIYPTHLIVDKKGVIIKVVNDVDELEIALNRELLIRPR